MKNWLVLMLSIMVLGGAGGVWAECIEGDCQNGLGKFKNEVIFYEGEWKEGKANGEGKWRNTAGAEYIGQYRDNYRHGIGTYTWPSGNVYKGEFFNDLKHGRGTHIWSDGRIHEGSWKNNVQHGQGTYTYPEGDIYVGSFENGMRHGQGTYTWPNGKAYEGLWKNDEPQDKSQFPEHPSNQNTFQSSFGQKLLGAIVGGVVEGVVDKALGNDEPCKTTVTTRSKQVVAGSPKYGKKDIRKTTFENCD